MGKTIGIDLGTTNSCVAVMRAASRWCSRTPRAGARPRRWSRSPSPASAWSAPSPAQAVTNPENTIFSIKRFMGRKEAEVREEETTVPYEVVARPNGDVRVEVGGRQYSPPEISAMILQKLRPTPRPSSATRSPGGDPVPVYSTTTSARRPRRPARSPAST